MSDFGQVQVVVLGSFISVALLLLYLASRPNFPSKDKDGHTIPSGPRGLPILGSFLDLRRYPELTLAKWASQHGPLYSFRVGQQLFIVISHPQIAKDLMITNGAVFSSRKDMFVKAQIVLKRRGITGSQYNDTWRKHRRIATNFLNPRAVESYTPVVERESLSLLQELYKATNGGLIPVNPQPHAGRASLNNILTIVFGIRTESVSDPLVGQVLKLSREFMNVTGPVANLVDFISVLQYFPNSMASRGRKLHAAMLKACGSLIADIEARLQRGEDVVDCMAKKLLLTKEKEKMEMLDIIILCGAFIIGGVETTAAIKQWFAALIPAYPEVQAKAHEELMRVVGKDRLPVYEDQKDLPYIRALIKELERWRNPFWLGTPHMATEDFNYNGVFIPKETVMILNTYSIHHDTTRYGADADRFNPDRYLGDGTTPSESANLSDPMARDHWMYGIGRRICPGMWLAEKEIFLAVSRMLWAFSMEEIPGQPIDIREYDGLSGRSPVPFQVKMIPRGPYVGDILQI